MRINSNFRLCEDELNQLIKPKDNHQKSNMLTIAGDDVKTLTFLGLTERQAKVYLALLLTGACKANTISDVSTVHRQEVYRVVASLQKIGLVETIVNTPKIFSAIPIEETLETLIQRKTKEFDVIIEKTRKMAQKLDRSRIQSNQLTSEPCFTVSEKDHGRKFMQAIENARKSIYVVTTRKRFQESVAVFDEAFKKALLRKVTIRIITEKAEEDTFPKWVQKALMKPNLKIEAIPDALSAIMSIFDNKEVVIAVDADADLREGTHLWSNSRNLIALAQAHFDSMWKQLGNKESKQ
jgi:sugar-specific transcriptional regulator TrmB